MAWLNKATYGVVALVGSCCMCGTLGALLGPHEPPPASGTTNAPSTGAPARAAQPSARSDAGTRAAAAPVPLDSAAVADALRVAGRAVDAAEAKLRARDFVTAMTKLAEAERALTPLDASSVDVTALRARIDPIRTQLRALGPTLESLAAARDALSGAHADALAQYEAVRAARAQLESMPNVPPELSRELSRTTRDLARAEDRLRGRALDIRTDRTIAERGLVRVTARELADVFRENEVVAESRYAGRRLAIDGVVDGVTTGMFGGATVHLRTSNMLMPVDADIERETAARLTRGTRVIMDCACNGAVIGRPQLDECRMLEFWQ